MRTLNTLNRSVLLSCMLISPIALSTNVKADLIHVSDFESDKIINTLSSENNDHWSIQSCHPHSYHVVKQGEMGAPPPRAGNYMVRFETRPTDLVPSECTKVSTNIVHSEFAGPWSITRGKERWVGFSFYSPVVDGAYMIGDCDVYSCSGLTGGKKELLIKQLHWGGGLTPHWFSVIGGQLHFGTYENQRQKRIKLMPMVHGRWVDVVMNFKFTDASDGFVKIWIDGKQVYDHRGANINSEQFAGRNGARRKIGLKTRHGWDDPSQSRMIMYYDEYRVGDANSSYEQVSPPGSAIAKLPESPRGLNISRN